MSPEKPCVPIRQFARPRLLASAGEYQNENPLHFWNNSGLQPPQRGREWEWPLADPRGIPSMRTTSFSLLTILCLALSATAFAQYPIIYSEGPIDGNDNAFFVTGPNHPSLA